MDLEGRPNFLELIVSLVREELQRYSHLYKPGRHGALNYDMDFDDPFSPLGLSGVPNFFGSRYGFLNSFGRNYGETCRPLYPAARFSDPSLLETSASTYKSESREGK